MEHLDYGTQMITLLRLGALLRTQTLVCIQTVLFLLMKLSCLDGLMAKSEPLESIIANSYGKLITLIKMVSQLFAFLITLNLSAQEV